MDNRKVLKTTHENAQNVSLGSSLLKITEPTRLINVECDGGRGGVKGEASLRKELIVKTQETFSFLDEEWSPVDNRIYKNY